jgi:hypothetical protein
MYCESRSWTTVTSRVTDISVHAAITVGQNMGIEAQMMAKSTSRQENVRTSGIHHVKSYIVRVLLYFTPLHRRRIAIKMTLYTVSQVSHMLDLSNTHIEPIAKRPVMARSCFLFNPGLKYSVSGMRKIARSKIMFDPENANIVFFASSTVL